MASASAIIAGRAYVELTTQNKTKGELKTALASIKSFASEAASLSKIPINLAFVSSLPLGYVGKTLMEFDDQMRLVAAVSKSTELEFESLTRTARELGRTTSWTSTQVAKGMTAMARMGYDSSFINSSIEGAMNFARATGEDIEFAANFMGKAMHQFGLDETQASRVADVLAATANSSAQTARDIEDSFRYAAPVAKALSLSIEDMGVLSGTLANFGIASSQAGTTLRRLQVNIADPSKQKYLMENFDIDVTDEEGNIRNLVDILTELGEAMKELPTGERITAIKKLFGVYSLAGATSLVGADFQKMADSIRNAVGESEKMSKFMDQGFGGAIRLGASAVEGLALALGDQLAPIIVNFSSVLQDATPGWVDWIKANKDLIVSVAQNGIELLKYSAILYGSFKTLSVMASIVNTARNAWNGYSKIVQAVTGATYMQKAALIAEQKVVEANEGLKQAEIASEKAGIVVKNAETAAFRASIMAKKEQATVEALLTKETAAKTKVDEISVSITNLETEATQLNTRANELNSRAIAQNTAVTNAQLKVNQLNGRVKASQTAILNKKIALEETSAKIVSLQSQNVEGLTKAQKKNLKESLAQARQDKKKLSASLHNRKATLLRQQAELADASATLKSAQAKQADTQAELNNISAKQKKISTSLASLKTTLAEKKAAYLSAVQARKNAAAIYQEAQAKSANTAQSAAEARALLASAKAKEAEALTALEAARANSSLAASRAAAFGKIAFYGALGGAVIAAGVAFAVLASSTDRAVKKAEKWVEINEAYVRKAQEENEYYQKHMSRLEELTNKEHLNNKEIKEASSIIDVLTQRYGNLGISIDKTTGKITGFIEAQNKISDMQLDVEKKAKEAELRSRKRLLDEKRKQAEKLNKSYSWASIGQDFRGINPFGEDWGKFNFEKRKDVLNEIKDEQAEINKLEGEIGILEAKKKENQPQEYKTVFEENTNMKRKGIHSAPETTDESTEMVAPLYSVPSRSSKNKKDGVLYDTNVPTNPANGSPILAQFLAEESEENTTEDKAASDYEKKINDYLEASKLIYYYADEGEVTAAELGGKGEFDKKTKELTKAIEKLNSIGFDYNIVVNNSVDDAYLKVDDSKDSSGTKYGEYNEAQYIARIEELFKAKNEESLIKKDEPDVGIDTKEPKDRMSEIKQQYQSLLSAPSEAVSGVLGMFDKSGKAAEAVNKFTSGFGLDLSKNAKKGEDFANLDDKVRNAEAEYYEALASGDKKEISIKKGLYTKAQNELKEYDRMIAGMWVNIAREKYNNDKSIKNKEDLDAALSNYKNMMEDVDEQIDNFSVSPFQAADVKTSGTFDAFSAFDYQFDWQRTLMNDQLIELRKLNKNVENLKVDDEDFI